MERLELPGGFYLSSVERGDAAALVEHLEEPAISGNTKSIPYPYTAFDAEAWIERRVEHTCDQPVEVTFAIRTGEGRLIGVMGAGDYEVETSHRTNVATGSPNRTGTAALPPTP